MPKHIPPPWIERRRSRIEDYGRDLKGLGGLQTSHIRAFKGGTYGAASRVRRLSPDERRAIEQRLREEGTID